MNVLFCHIYSPSARSVRTGHVISSYIFLYLFVCICLMSCLYMMSGQNPTTLTTDCSAHAALEVQPQFFHHPVQPALYRTQVLIQDLRDLLQLPVLKKS